MTGACPDAWVLASHSQLLDTSTGEVDGGMVTLDTGECADLVLWLTPPEGLPLQDVLSIEGDEMFQAGASYFAVGGGSRPQVRFEAADAATTKMRISTDAPRPRVTDHGPNAPNV